MKRFSTILALVMLWSIPQWAASSIITTSGTTCIPSTNCLVVSLPQDKGGSTLTLSGTWTGTIQFEATGDGGATWVAVSVTPLNSTTTVTSTTGNGTWQVNVAGFTGLRMRASATVTGSAFATINPSAASARSNGGSSSGGSGTVTSVLGTANQVDVTASTTTPTVSLDSAITFPGSATVASGNTFTIASGATLTCASGSTCPGGLSPGGSAGDIQINGGSSNLAAGALNDNGTTITATESITPKVAAAKNLGTALLPFGDIFIGGTASEAADFITSALSANRHITVQDAASTITTTVQEAQIPTSAPTGILRGGSPFTGAELSGFGTTSGSNAVVPGVVASGQTLTIQSGGTLTCSAGSTCPAGTTYTGTAPIAVSGTAISLQNSTPANITSTLGTGVKIITASGNASTQNDVMFGDVTGGLTDPGYGNAGSSSTWMGQNSNIPSGVNNTGFGEGIGKAGATGSNNTFVGQNSYIAATTGSFNTYFGVYAGTRDTTGNLNTGIGYEACGAFTTGNYNTCVGALAANTDGVSGSSQNGVYFGSSNYPAYYWYFPSGVTNTSTPSTMVWHVTGIVTTVDTAGGSWDYQMGAGTGAATPSIAQIDGPVARTTGATAQTEVNRLTLNDTKALTSGSATTVITIPLATLQTTGGQVFYTITVTDGTNNCSTSGMLVYNGENSGGVYVLNPATLGTGVGDVPTCKAVSSLSDTWALVAGTNQAFLQVTPTTSITPSTGGFIITYEIHHQGMTQPTAF